MAESKIKRAVVEKPKSYKMVPLPLHERDVFTVEISGKCAYENKVVIVVERYAQEAFNTVLPMLQSILNDYGYYAGGLEEAHDSGLFQDIIFPEYEGGLCTDLVDIKVYYINCEGVISKVKIIEDKYTINQIKEYAETFLTVEAVCPRCEWESVPDPCGLREFLYSIAGPDGFDIDTFFINKESFANKEGGE